MRALIVLIILGLAVLCICGSDSDSSYSTSNSTEDFSSAHSPSESHSNEAVIKMRRNTANSLVKKRQKRSYGYYEWIHEQFKSPMEMKKEQCEEYWPCDYLSRQVGFHQAYRRYFGPV
ncbi:osteocalcin [Microcaecilia unicolor]|uniref:Osteocalcin-like n=1 Tax=Microcaecilia unicolor TaxID=1415580 RepID=A0A6P7XU37_9AMPH|nr:osteocalcin-like [Microcaecilia unicolor]